MAQRNKKKEALNGRIVKTQESRGNWQYEDEEFDRSTWKADVAAGDTQLGYFDWVIHNLESQLGD